jgi:RNA polymerase sigma-70 factor (ECF subfamily)
VLNNHHNAEEAASDVFCNMVDKVKYFQAIQETDLPGLIYVCAKNMAINHYNKLFHQSENEMSATYYSDDESEGIQRSFADESVDIVQTVLDNEFLRYVAELIKVLPNDQQAVIMLKYFYNFRNDEIADIMGVNRNNIDSKVYRAKNNLQKLLTEAKVDI